MKINKNVLFLIGIPLFLIAAAMIWIAISYDKIANATATTNTQTNDATKQNSLDYAEAEIIQLDEERTQIGFQLSGKKKEELSESNKG